MEKNVYVQPEESFVQKIFGCCFERNNNEFELESEETNREVGFLGRSKMVFDNELSLFPANMIRPDEKNKIKFTKDELVEYIKNLQGLVFPIIYNDNTIKISKRNYTELNQKNPLIRCEIVKHKIYFTEIPTIEKMINIITNPQLRKKWDKNVKDYKIIGKIKRDSEIIKTVTNKQLSVIPEKEFIDKRVGIFKDNVYYLFSSSVPDDIFPSNGNYDRAKNFMSIMVIKEDNDDFFIDCFIQIDVNINIPIEFIEANLLNKVKTFFDKYFEFLNTFKNNNYLI